MRTGVVAGVASSARCFSNARHVFMSGSWVYGAARREQSDLDINIVLAAGARLDPEHELELREFIGAYVSLHHRYGYRPDAEFPGEIFSEDQLAEACEGRGLFVSDDHLSVPVADAEFWRVSEEHWYLAWLGAVAFSLHVYGNPVAFATYRESAWDTIVSYLALRQEAPNGWSAGQLMGQLVGSDKVPGPFGIHPAYVDFEHLERASLDAAVARLRSRGLVSLVRAGRYTCEPALRSWERSLVNRLTTGDFKAAPFMTVQEAHRFALR